MALTWYDMKFIWTITQQAAFITLKGALIQAPISHYQDPLKHYIVYIDTSDNANEAQLSQEHNGQVLPVAFLSHTFTNTQHKWSTPEQEAYGICNSITK